MKTHISIEIELGCAFYIETQGHISSHVFMNGEGKNSHPTFVEPKAIRNKKIHLFFLSVLPPNSKKQKLNTKK